MADGDLGSVQFIGQLSHIGSSAETVLTIPTVTDRHMALEVVVMCQDDGDSSAFQMFRRSLIVQQDAGTPVVQLSSDTGADLDPNTTGYTVSVTTSGTNVLVQVTAVAGVRSAARAHGVFIEQGITGA